jgi:hypothetical protein
MRLAEVPAFGLGCGAALPRFLGIPRGPHSKASGLAFLDVSQKGPPTHNEPRCIQATAGLWLRLGEAICDLGRFEMRTHVPLAFTDAIAR